MIDMSFIPSSAGGITNLTSTPGSGIVTATSFGSSELSSGLVAGTNVTLTATSAFAGRGLRIDTSPGIAGVTSVNAGTGITLTGTAENPIVNNAGVLGVTATSGILITGTGANPVVNNDGVLTVNSQNGAVTIASAGGTIAITNPAPGTINLEQSGGGGTLTGITAGTGIAVTGSAPSPTVSNTGVLSVSSGSGIAITGPAQNPSVANTGVLSLTAGNNMLVSAPSGSVVLAAKVARPMSFTLAGARSGFPINNGAYGSFGLNTLTTFGNLLAGFGEFVGVNTGTVIMDMSSYGLTTVTGQPGGYNVYVKVTGQPDPGILCQSLQPTSPDGATQDTAFNLGLLTFTMADFRTAYGATGTNAFLTVNILNSNTNQVFPGGNAVNFIAWYWPDSTQ